MRYTVTLKFKAPDFALRITDIYISYINYKRKKTEGICDNCSSELSKKLPVLPLAAKAKNRYEITELGTRPGTGFRVYSKERATSHW